MRGKLSFLILAVILVISSCGQKSSNYSGLISTHQFSASQLRESVISLIEDLSIFLPGEKVIFIVHKGLFNQIEDIWLEELDEQGFWYEINLEQVQKNALVGNLDYDTSTTIPVNLVYRLCVKVNDISACKYGEKIIFP